MQQNAAEPFDLVLRGGSVIDPAEGLDAIRDVGIRHGRIAALAPALDTAGCPDIREAAGTYVCPGLIDLHGHWYEGRLYGIHADIGLNHAVTTAVDAGSTGFANFPRIPKDCMAASRTRLLAFVHVSFLGLHAPFAEELLELRYARPLETAAVIDEHRGVVVGVKVRIGAMTGDHGNAAFDLARQAAEAARVPLMVHISTGADDRCSTLPFAVMQPCALPAWQPVKPHIDSSPASTRICWAKCVVISSVPL